MTNNEIPEKRFDKIVPQPPPPPQTPAEAPPEDAEPEDGHPHFREPRPKLPTFRFPDELRDRLLTPVFDRLMWGYTTDEIAEQIAELVNYKRTPVILNRNLIYRLARYAWMTGQIFAFPEPHEVLARDVAGLSNLGDIQVVPDRGGLVENPVAEAGAKMVHGLIKETARKREGPVHVGFGIGQSTRRLARVLARMMRADRKSPDLVVHALTTGHSVWDPLETPISFFSYFAESGFSEAKFVGLFAEPLVPVEDYADALRSQIVQEAFERRSELDVVVTSLASSADEHGHLYQYLARFVDPEAPRRLLERGWVGDQQLRPYSATEPLEITEGMKPITLFEIEDLVAFARQRGKHVVLLCSPCGKCGRVKDDALVPMLTSPKLHIWNHLLVDELTAEAVFPHIGNRDQN